MTYAQSDNGWIDTELFELWLREHFLKHAVSSRPLLLILDGHKAHCQFKVCEVAKNTVETILQFWKVLFS